MLLEIPDNPKFYLRTIPDPILRQQAKKLTIFNDVLHLIVESMHKIMYKEKGIGIAAPQIGISQRIICLDIPGEKGYYGVLINPGILQRSGNQKDLEGCLSVPGRSEYVTRHDYIKVSAFTMLGNYFEIEANGLVSRAIQHEIDHLNGVLFVDKARTGNL
jgi:peptide deformylase